MRLTLFQRSVVVVAAAAVTLQLLFPPTYRERPDLPATMLNVFAILIASGTIFWLNPGRKVLVSAAVVVGVGGALLGSLALWHALTPRPPHWEVVPPAAPPSSGRFLPPLESPTPSPTVQAPPVPTVSVLADSVIVSRASSVLNYWVDSLNQTFQQLHAEDKDTLCAAGKAIRDSMKAHRNTLADLNHVERAIYDITAPAGRCH